MLQGTYVSGTVYIYFAKINASGDLATECQYFANTFQHYHSFVLLKISFCQQHFTGTILSAAICHQFFLLPFCQHFFAIFCGHLPAAYCQHHVTSSILTAELYKHYKHFDSILQVSFCQTFSSSILPAAFCQQHFARILAA